MTFLKKQMKYTNAIGNASTFFTAFFKQREADIRFKKNKNKQ